MNSITIVGNIGNKNPEISYTQDSKMICKFSVADRVSADKTNWFNCVAFGKTAENISKYFESGSRIAISGRIKQEKYKNKDGVEKEYQTVAVDSWDFAGDHKKPDNTNTQSAPKPAPEPQKKVERNINLDDIDITDIASDDLPF